MSATRRKGLKAFGRYLAVRGVSVAISLLIAVFLVVFIANLGGKLDEIVYLEAKTAVQTMLFQNPTTRKQIDTLCEGLCKPKVESGNVTMDLCISQCRDSYAHNYTVNVVLKSIGLDPNTPPIVRIISHYLNVLALNLGRAMRLFSFKTRSQYVYDIIAEALPQTILLFTTANIIIFFSELYLGLILSRRYGMIADKIAVSLAPLSSMPGWFYGIFMLMLLSIWPKQAFDTTIFPSGGMMSYPPPENLFMKALDVLWHMALPIISWMIAYLPIGVYNYRTFFLIFSTEEYVEYAKARGVPENVVLRRYILRPTLPPIITSFVLTLIASWMGAIITERVFNWPGLGTVFYTALGGGVDADAPVVIGIIVIYAYLLAASVVALDIVYGIVDPRVRVTR